MAFHRQGNYKKSMFMSIILSTQLWTVQHFRLLHFSSLITSLIFSLTTKTSYKKKKQIPWLKFHSLKEIFLQNNSALRNVKCDWSISFMQIGRNRTHLFFRSCIIQIFVHQVCMNSLFQGPSIKYACLNLLKIWAPFPLYTF